ncbi:MAG: ABC transporter permease [Candidatus Bathyarchaeota archaeon]|nr:MAG: ABC transporter permease [Candidatus Bathyarchaeota archaeon]
MASLFSRDKRIIWMRRIRNFWEEFSHTKIGLVGLGLLVLYILVAALSPWLTPYDPIAQPRLAQSFAMPEWVTVFPQFSNLTKTRRITLSWNVENDPLNLVTGGWGTSVGVQYKAGDLQPVLLVLHSKFSYAEIPPNEFFQQFAYQSTDTKDVEYSVTLNLVTPEGEIYQFWDEGGLTGDRGQWVTRDSKDPLFIAALFPNEPGKHLGKVFFTQKGEYTFVLELRFRPKSMDATAQLEISDSKLVILGHVHGILGADYFAKDIWAQVVYGAQLSLAIGFLAAIVGTSIGILVGVVSGYLGGIADEVSMRIVDILLCLPLLPLLLALVNLYGRNVYYIVLFIAIFGWQGLARVIRSQTLSIRETAYIETARASGAGGFYIMLRHIIPNIIPVAFASMVLAVPSAILFESALSFLGFGDPRVPTWGKMLQHAFQSGAFINLAWWWIIPPGIAIIGICMAFVFIGFAFDEIVNPRLRRRR